MLCGGGLAGQREERRAFARVIGKGVTCTCGRAYGQGGGEVGLVFVSWVV